MLSVRQGAKAVDFYKAAFGAVELFRIDSPTGEVVARLAVDGPPAAAAAPPVRPRRRRAPRPVPRRRQLVHERADKAPVPRPRIVRSKIRMPRRRLDAAAVLAAGAPGGRRPHSIS